MSLLSQSRRAVHRRFVVAILAVVLSVPTFTALPASAAEVVSPPAGLSVVSRSKIALSFSWSPVDGADSYIVRYARKSSMAGAKELSVVAPYAELNKLRVKTYYYVCVATVSGGVTSECSAVVKAKTDKRYTYLAPAGLSATVGSTVANLAWTSRSSKVYYRVVYAASKTFVNAKKKVFRSPYGTLTGLTANTTYFVKIKAVSTRGATRSRYSPAITFTTNERPASSGELRVASYNIRCDGCTSLSTNEKPWSTRRTAVAEGILGQDVDVIGIQEASNNKTYANGAVGQYEDLLYLLNATRNEYSLVNDTKNLTIGTRIIYNNTRLTLLDQGYQQLSNSEPGSRFVVWAVFRQQSGKEFFFTNTHLEVRGDNANRVRETKEILSLIQAKNTDKLPVLSVGDYNASEKTNPVDGPQEVTKAAGYIEPLGGQWPAKTAEPGATVEHRIRTDYASTNHFDAVAPHTVSAINSLYYDYIFTSPGVAVPEWETVVKIDSSSNFVGVIPSDHNMVRATVILP